MRTKQIRSDSWKEFQHSQLLTEASFQEEESFKEALSQGPDSGNLETHIAPGLNEGLDISGIEEGRITDRHWYGRYGSAPERALVERLVKSEAGYVLTPQSHIDGVVFDSGMSAISQTLDLIARKVPFGERSGKRFLVGNTLYYRTNGVVNEEMEENGFNPALVVDTTNPEEVEKALRENGENILALFYEPVTNPLIEITDTRRVSEIARRYDVPVIVDNTLLTADGQQAFRLGADVIIHSLTKYVSGEGDILAGAVIAPEKFAKELRTYQSRGGVLAPKDSLTLYERMESLPDRMKVYRANSVALSDALSSFSEVEKVNYSTNLSDVRDGLPGAVLSFRMKGENKEERQHWERKIVNALAREDGPISCKTSFGDQDYGVLGQSTFGWETPEKYDGVIRISAGSGDVNLAVKHLTNAFNTVYGGLSK